MQRTTLKVNRVSAIEVIEIQLNLFFGINSPQSVHSQGDPLHRGRKGGGRDAKRGDAAQRVWHGSADAEHGRTGHRVSTLTTGQSLSNFSFIDLPFNTFNTPLHSGLNRLLVVSLLTRNLLEDLVLSWKLILL